jgi:hypothetical protein
MKQGFVSYASFGLTDIYTTENYMEYFSSMDYFHTIRFDFESLNILQLIVIKRDLITS